MSKTHWATQCQSSLLAKCSCAASQVMPVFFKSRLLVSVQFSVFLAFVFPTDIQYPSLKFMMCCFQLFCDRHRTQFRAVEHCSHNQRCLTLTAKLMCLFFHASTKLPNTLLAHRCNRLLELGMAWLGMIIHKLWLLLSAVDDQSFLTVELLTV